MDRPEIVHTPYVIWGAGVSVHAAHNWKKFEEYKDGPLYWLRDNYFSEDKAAVRTWAAHIYEPHFIDQVDFAPLMVTPFSQFPQFTNSQSTIMGVDIPLQSMGKVRNTQHLVSISSLALAQSIYANTEQLWAQFHRLLSTLLTFLRCRLIFSTIEADLWLQGLYHLGLLGRPLSTNEIFQIECALGDKEEGLCPPASQKAIRNARITSNQSFSRALRAIEAAWRYASLPAFGVVLLSYLCLGYFLMGYALFPEHRPFVTMHSKEVTVPWVSFLPCFFLAFILLTFPFAYPVSIAPRGGIRNRCHVDPLVPP